MTLLEPEVFSILRGFYSLVPPHSMDFPAQLSASILHEFLLSTILFNQHFRQYPPSVQYQRTFWKRAIYHLEHMTPDEACTFVMHSRDGSDKHLV